MTLAEECISRGIAPSKRGLSRLLGRAPNYVSESGGFSAEDLVHLRLVLIAGAGNADLIGRVERMLLEPWW